MTKGVRVRFGIPRSPRWIGTSLNCGLRELGWGAIIASMAAKSKKDGKDGTAAVNKKAYRNFELVEKFEAGLQLVGTEVKSLREGQADLNGAYARIRRGECWLVGASITQYAQASFSNHEPLRDRKLLLHKAQIRKITT